MDNIALIVVKIRINGKLCHADDQVERGPDFMTNIGKKLDLGTILVLRIDFCRIEGISLNFLREITENTTK